MSDPEPGAADPPATGERLHHRASVPGVSQPQEPEGQAEDDSDPDEEPREDEGMSPL